MPGGGADMAAKFLLRMLLPVMLVLASLNALAFDHGHRAWSELVAKHVKVAADGRSSRVDYAGFAADRAAFDGYLKSLAAVAEADYRRWTKAQQLAFLINAYNAWTIDLVLGRYPDLKSIKEIGSLFQSPWKKKFIPLLGMTVSLDDIEHGQIRAPGSFDEPRIHAALVCASIGCPMLRAEAFVAERLDSQFEDGMSRFLGDASRNRFDAASGRLLVSRLFDWYGDDFAKGQRGFLSLPATFARYAEQLAATPEARERIRRGDYTLSFMDYDWRLNDVR